MVASRTAPSRSFDLSCHGRTFQAFETPIIRAAAAEFASGFEEGTLQFFDAVLPRCDRFIDCGAYIGFTALYAATQVCEVHAFEASPTNFAMLEANVACNPELGERIAARHLALGDRDDVVSIYCKAVGDSGSSIFRDIQRSQLIRGQMEAMVPMRAAPAALGAIGVDRRTLVKIDIEGAEYQVIPAMAELLAATKPFVHVSFHPFNIVVSDDEYVNSVARLRSALAVADTLAHYEFMYVYTDEGWNCIDKPARLHFLRHYLLAPKPVARIATPQYGFTDAIAFSAEPIAELGG